MTAEILNLGPATATVAPVRGLITLLSRALKLDSSALVRLRQYKDSVEVFVTTPYGVLAARRIPGTIGRDGLVVSAEQLCTLLKQYIENPVGLEEGVQLSLGAGMDASWPGALPATSNFELVDTIPVMVVSQLADQGQALAQQFSGPLGPPRSLLDQIVLTVNNQDTELTDTELTDTELTPALPEKSLVAEIPMRMIFTCTALGLIPGFREAIEIPRYLRVSTLGSWVRIDAPFGSVYYTSRVSVLF
ncbi:hypothetical protein [Corynebacterium caspium]|uniref:hypothetical protein n=1 Tax=Corynebacterium caspium TaxID=234828 RepID=UPI0003696031|nr:hypothetical protein [Corynebacterium caspium]WKD58825.1 hypothetical protein CCASP_02065 [Corynebacterium caspium DSM 44850]